MNTYSRINVWLTLLCLTMGGCMTAPVKFQLIDAETKLKLSGVIMRQDEVPKIGLTPDFASSSRHLIEYKATSSDGIAITDPLDLYHYEIGFEFDKSGYQASMATRLNQSPKVEVEPAAPTNRIYRSSGLIYPADSLIIIPMYRIGDKSAPKY